MIHQLDKKTRINLKYYFSSLDTCFLLQRKKWWGWKTVSWTYPSTHKGDGIEAVLHFLEYKENFFKEKKQTQRDIGLQMMAKFSKQS